MSKILNRVSVEIPLCFLAESESDQVADPATYTVGAFSSSRFIIAAMAMLTAEHEAVDLSLLLNEGVVGIAQTALRLAG